MDDVRDDLSYSISLYVKAIIIGLKMVNLSLHFFPVEF